MWRRIVWSLMMGIVLSLQLSVVAFAQVASRPSSLLSRTSVAQFELVLGKITPTNMTIKYALSESTAEQTSGAQETLTFSFCGQVPVIHYEYVSPEERLVLDFNRNQEVLIHHLAFEPQLQHQGSPVMEAAFRQDAHGGVRLAVLSADSTVEYKAVSLWHLILAEPQVARTHLIPLLEQIRPNWDLSLQAQELPNQLLNFRKNYKLPEPSRIAELVARLGDPAFQKRQAADRELRQFGVMVIPYLQSIDRTTLDHEQKSRIESILVSVHNVTCGDTPERTVHWLAADKSVWVNFLTSDDPIVREKGAEHLALLTGKPLDYSATASAEDRLLKVEQLRRNWFGE